MKIALLILYLTSFIFYLLYLFKQKIPYQKYGLYFIFIAFIFHGYLVLNSFFIFSYLPVYTIYDNLFLFSFAISAMYMFLRFATNLKMLGLFASFLNFCLLLIILNLTPSFNEPNESLKNLFVSFHVLTGFLAYAALIFASFISIFFLALNKAIKSKKQSFFFLRLPSLEFLDKSANFSINVGFLILSISLISGIIYFKKISQSFWTNDPKEIASLISWFLYATLIHARIAFGVRGKKAAIATLIGLLCVLFTFFGTNALTGTYHSQFTR